MKNAGFEVGLVSPIKKPLTDDDLDAILTKCDEESEVIVGARRIGSTNLVLYAKDKCQKAVKLNIIYVLVSKNIVNSGS